MSLSGGAALAITNIEIKSKKDLQPLQPELKTIQNTDGNKKKYFYSKGLFVAVHDFLRIRTPSNFRRTYLLNKRKIESRGPLFSHEQ